MEYRYATSPDQVEKMDTTELRNTFLVSNLFQDDEICFTYTYHDRVIIGSAVPASRDLVLNGEPSLKTAFFLERRELGIVNIGATGQITIDGQVYTLHARDCLYVGLGHQEVKFNEGKGRYYLVSTLAHTSYPTGMVKSEEAYKEHLGGIEHSNERTLYRFIHKDGLQSCQLMLGLTSLDRGSVWNTMPAHLHDRRMEVYLYFGMPDEDRVFHLMGRPEATRHIVVANEQAVISPGWSIHAGAGTSNYSFIWAMAGENYTFTDMDKVSISALR
jgi:4-deoxy-L-threo-5-hexosulose-uronate ketol-isomerase